MSVGVFYGLTLRAGHDWGGDFSHYIHHAKNIAQGQPYRETGYLYNPSDPVAPRYYPPVFPLLLSLPFTLFGLNLAALKGSIVLVFCGALMTIFLTLRKESDDVSALLVIGLMGFHPYLWEFKDQILSDIPFLLFCWLSLLFLGKALRDQGEPAWRNLLLGSTALILAYGTRGLGLIVLGAALGVDIYKHRKITRLSLVPLLFLAFFVLFILRGSSETNYLDLFTHSFQVSRVWYHWELYTKELRDLWANGYAGALMRALFLIVNGLALTGYARRIRQFGLLESFGLVYLAAILFWPVYQGVRLWIPILPLYFFYALLGLQWLSDYFRLKHKKLILPGLLLCIACTYIGRYTTLNFGPLTEGVGLEKTQRLFSFLREQTPPEAVYICSKPRVFSLYTGRASSSYHNAEESEFHAYLKQIGASHAILSDDFGRDENVLRPFLEKQGSAVKKIYAQEGFEVYEFN